MNGKNLQFFTSNYRVLLILLVSACMQESEPLEDGTKVTVKDAKAFYEKNFNYSKESSARNENSIYDKKQLSWDKSYYRNRRNGHQALIIPITFEKDLFVVSSETGLKFPVENRIYGFVYRDRNQIHFEVFHWVPTDNNLNFTGYLVVKDLNGQTLRYYLYENGEFVNELAVDENDTNDGGRVEVTFIETCYYTCTVRNSGPDECYLDYCRIEAVSEPARMASPGGPDTGGGGEGGSENGMCPHPFIANYWISCDEVEECNEFSIVDNYGNCLEYELTLNPYKKLKNTNDCEKQLLVLYKPQAYIIFNNSKIAHSKTQEIFGAYDPIIGIGYNDCADAFRHAYWNALNVQSVNSQIATLFATAHECDSEQQKESEMDLYNNKIGREIGNMNNSENANQLALLVMTSLYNGQLKVLSNLGSGNVPKRNSNLINSDVCN